MSHKPMYAWDKEKGLAICILTDKDNNTYYGEAQCHDDDRDFISEKTGLFIAESRAKICYLRHIRDAELIPELKALKHFKSNISQSSHYNEESYESKMLNRQIRIKEEELNSVRQEIKEELKNIKKYWQEKDELYQQIRRQRKVKSE